MIMTASSHEDRAGVQSFIYSNYTGFQGLGVVLYYGTFSRSGVQDSSAQI